MRNLSDYGNAERLIDHCGDDLLNLRGTWYVWDGTRYRVDESGDAEWRAKEAVRAIYAEAAATAHADSRKRVATHALASESRSRIAGMVSLAASEREVVVRSADELDADPWLLNCTTGTVDLRTGVLGPHSRVDRLTLSTGIPYDPAAVCPAWDAFLERILPDGALREFMAKIVGYSLTGGTGEEKLFMLNGSGANGKSTFVNMIRGILGEYAIPAPPDLLIAKQNVGVSNDVAQLRGARLVTAVETDDGARLNEIRVKELVSGDPQRARFLHQEFFTFKPQAKYWIATNHRPIVRGSDEAIWRRMVLIPFSAFIPAAERDCNLDGKLRAELPGILAWAVRGCLAWQRDGLVEPPVIRFATTGYRDEQDLIGGFIRDKCVLETGAQVQSTPLYAAYEEWCRENGENVQSQRRFAQRVQERNLVKRKSNGVVMWQGIRVRRMGEVDLDDSDTPAVTYAVPAHTPSSEPMPQAPPEPAASSQPRRGLHLYGVVGSDGLTIVTDRRAGPTEPMVDVSAANLVALARRYGLEALWLHESHGWASSAPGWQVLQQGEATQLELCSPGQIEGGSTWELARTGRELAQALAAFEAAVGFRFRATPATTGLSMLGMLHHRKGANPLVDPGPLPDCLDHERALRWSRPLTDAERGHRYVHGLDKHGAYLAAAADLAVGIGTPGHIEGGRFDPKVPGVWRVAQGNPGLRSELLPSVFCGDPRETRWRSTPTLAYAIEQGGEVEVLEAWVWPKAGKPLTTFYTRFRDGRTWLMGDDTPAGRIALSVLKEVYAATLGGALAANRTGARDVPGSLYRPDWRSFIVARARVNLLRNMDKHKVTPFAVNVDEMLFTSDSPDPASVGLPLGDGLGEYGVNHYLEPTEPQWDLIFRAAHAGRTNDLLTAIK